MNDINIDLIRGIAGGISDLADRIIFSIEANPDMDASLLKSTALEISKLALMIHQNRMEYKVGVGI